MSSTSAGNAPNPTAKTANSIDDIQAELSAIVARMADRYYVSFSGFDEKTGEYLPNWYPGFTSRAGNGAWALAEDGTRVRDVTAERVISPALGGIIVGHEIARALEEAVRTLTTR